MAVTRKFDFSGYATKANIVCSDGRTIKPDAFKKNDGTRVPLVWQHLHNSPDNILGHAVLENRKDGVYAYCTFNTTESGIQAKALVLHGDITAMSIYANQLVEKGRIVHEGAIREVSLVLSGANPGASIDNISIEHSDGSLGSSEDEAIIKTGLEFELFDETKKEKKEVEHADDQPTKDGETIADVLATLDPKQKVAVAAVIEELLAEAGNIQQSDLDETPDEGEKLMKTNVFEKSDDDKTTVRHTLTREQFRTIFSDANRLGSLKQSFLAHAEEFGYDKDLSSLQHETPPPYGIGNIDYLFPDARTVTPTPTFVQRDMAWVSVWMNGTRHTPFSRIKSLFADITVETARALGYIKGNMKKEEFFELARRVTTPTTVYKKQKLDRDDVVDITDFDVVAWLRNEMRMMLDEEVARAGLIGDGRDVASEDKINETNIRPVYTDDDLYAFRVQVLSTATVIETMEAIIRGRKNYKGTGNPVMFCTTDFLTDMLLVKDTLNRRLYNSVTDLQAALRVSSIVEVPVMEGQEYVDDVPNPDVTYSLLAILLNPADYTYGADKGGAVSLFDDFDIDFNQMKYLIETRLSGALINPKTAMIVEKAKPAA